MSNQEIFEKYYNSQPSNIQYKTRDAARLHGDFLLFVDHHKHRTAADINVDHLNSNFSEQQKSLYKEAMATLMHPIWGRFKEPSFVSGNTLLYTLNRDGGSYSLEQYEFNRARSVTQISDAKVELSATALKLSSNNGVKLTLERTGETYDTNKHDKSAEPNVVPIWQLKVEIQGKRKILAHLVDLKME